MKILFYQTTAICFALAGSACVAHADTSFGDALTAAKPILDSNLRSEHVTQSGFAQAADALTWRNRFGFETGSFAHLKLLVEAENVTVFSGDYNSTLNGKTAFPTVLDPRVTELNRAQITWSPDAATTVTFGRQRMLLDDQRFIGNVGWRQDEQTFDALRLDTGSGPFKLTAAYLSRVNRVVADAKDWHSNSYLINASYAVNAALKVTAFDYALKFSTAATAPTAADTANAYASSVVITGVRAGGSYPCGQVRLGYMAQYAAEKNNGNNPQSFHLGETMIEASAGWKIYTLKVNYESLGGNGTVGFVAPLGTAHAFQGFDDAFSATGGNKTTVNGIDDLNYALVVAIPAPFKPALSVIYHDLSTARLDQRLGREWDAVANFSLTPHLSLLVKYADFDAATATAPASRRKTWIAFQYKL